MRYTIRLIWIMLLALAGSVMAKDFERLLGVATAAESWVVKQGYPLFYTAARDQFRIEGQRLTPLHQFGDAISIELSPSAAYAVLSSLQALEGIKGAQRDGSYSVIAQNGDLVFQVIRSTEADLKPLVPAVSDEGILALADPIKAMVYVYESGNLITEIQLYGSTADFSMERKLQMCWMGDKLYILLEHPDPVGDPAANALLFLLGGKNYDQQTFPLPFSNVASSLVTQGHIIIGGYDYDPVNSQMRPSILEIDQQGRILWTNASFGHELSLSSNGRYLAALASHEEVNVFDLSNNRIKIHHYDHQNQASLGLAVNDRGEVALIRVPIDFFVKQNTFFTQLFFPDSQSSMELQLNPRSRKLFKVHSFGSNFYIGTGYEWLRIVE